ncbi:hypothetical protein LTR86_002895 [Recurvomyces mirabilis]|nr:hypothetical protein LTR86_002895 [Recurvomyces mirabilis]
MSAIRARSPDTVSGGDRKRRRKVLSCYDCRRRKLQCDRVMPACGRCTKAGQASNCLYLDEPGEGSIDAGPNNGPSDSHLSRPTQAPSTVASSDALARLEFQEKRIKQLEAALPQSGYTQSLDPLQRMRATKLPPTPESVIGRGDQAAGNVVDRETMMLRGGSFKTHFHGITHTGSLIALIPELNLFTREAFEKFPALARIRQDMHALEDRTEYAGSTSRQTTEDALKALIPPRSDTDQLLRLYFDSYGHIYHILHLPSFWRQYEELWTDLTNAPAHFVAIVLLITAAAQCLSPQQPWLYTANSSTARERAVTCIQACDDWLQTQSQKHVKAADFQIRFLLLLAKSVSAWKFKRTWTDAGTLLRFCMGAGLHRNPDLIRKPTSALDKELRRRIWAALIEFDLQTSFDRGMLAGQWPLQADTTPPSNIDDDELRPESEHLPRKLPASDFTSASYLSLASDSIMLRHGLNTTLNNIRQSLSFDDVKHYTEEIEAQLSAIPDWLGKSAEIPKALLSLNLRQYLLELHGRQLRQSENVVERSFSRMILVDNATRIIDTLRSVSDGGSHALQLMCSHHLRAALSICHVATSTDIQADSAIGQIIEHHADRVMQEAVQLLTEKVFRFGREQRQLWVALAAHGFWKSKKDPSQRAVYMQEAVDKITRPYYRIMASQEDALSKFGTGVTGKESQGVLEYMPPVGAGTAVPDGADEVLPIFDLDEIEAWTFENFFGPDELQQAFLDPPYATTGT